jgi:plasmid stabilization system protein ParE
VRARLVLRPQALAELVAARDWFDAQRPGLGQEFVVEVDVTMSEVLTRPESFPLVHGEKRRAIVHRFPYGVFFRIVDDAIVILGIIHGRRDPESWRHRQ